MADVPSEVRYGRVVGRFVLVVADSDDPGNLPEELPLGGTITLTPNVRIMRFPTTDPARLAVISPIVCTLVDGWLTAEGNTEPGVNLVASEQPEGQPSNIQWTATFQFDGLTSTQQPSPVIIEVPPDTEVDLTTIVPVSPDPGTVELVTHEDWADIQEIYQQIQDIIAGGGMIQGADGREVELRASDTAIEWRYSGTTLWASLVMLADLQGPQGLKGDKGDDGEAGPPNSLTIGSVTSTSTPQASITGAAPNQVLNLGLPKGADGSNGNPGADGRQVQLRVSGGYIQWQYVGDPVWSNLVSLSSITGPAGADGTALPALTQAQITTGTDTTKSAITAAVFKAAVTALQQNLTNRVTALEARGKIGLSQSVVNYGPTDSTQVLMPQLTVTVAATGSDLLLELSGHLQCTVANDRLGIIIRRGTATTDPEVGNFVILVPYAGVPSTVILRTKDTPPEGSVTYGVWVYRAGGTGQVTWISASNRPGLLTVEKP